MGQYFLIVNLDRKEYIDPPLKKLWEIAANPEIGGVLAYLLATDNPDGTGLYLKWMNNELKWFGKWCGDRIALVGDYGRQAPNFKKVGTDYNTLIAEFKDITDDVINEYLNFLK